MNYILVANINPFRYRGYYYDPESGLYYLNTRYYDPETGRFINADNVSILSESASEINGLNLFSYCFNNPVNWSWKKFFGWAIVAIVAVACVALSVVSFGAATPLAAAGFSAGIAGIIGMGSSIISQGISKGWNNINPFQVAFNGMMGMASAAAMVSALGWASTGLIVGGVGFVNSVGNELFDNGGDLSEVNWGRAALIGSISGLVAGTGKYIATSTKLMNLFTNSTNSVKQAALRTDFFTGSSLSRMAYQEFWQIIIKQQALFRSGTIMLTNILRSGFTFGVNSLWQ